MSAPLSESERLQVDRLERFLHGRPYSVTGVTGRGWLEVSLVLPEWRTTAPIPALWIMWKLLWNVWLGVWLGVKRTTWVDPEEQNHA